LTNVDCVHHVCSLIISLFAFNVLMLVVCVDAHPT